MSRLCSTTLIATWLLLASVAASSADPATYDRCLIDSLKRAAGNETATEIRSRCASPAPGTNPPDTAPAAPGRSPIDARIAAERQSLERSYSLTPYRPNFLLATHNANPNPLLSEDFVDGAIDNEEAILQISVKFPMWHQMFGSNNDLMFAYTSRSWFQAFNERLSKPFRETNYEPEVFLRHFSNTRMPLGARILGWDLGYNHQSNGRSRPLSRSWDRIFGQLRLELTPNMSMLLRAWYRLPESESEDDNPKMHRYLGYGDIRGIWAPNRNTFTAMIRPGTDKGALELTWSYPINNHIRFYAQYFNGYGESLIDYDHRVERIGIGFTINDYLHAR